jgi:hypothetical protein
MFAPGHLSLEAACLHLRGSRVIVKHSSLLTIGKGAPYSISIVTFDIESALHISMAIT